MKEFVEKLIGRLLLESSGCKVYKLINPNKEDIAEFNAYKKCIEIVNQLAEEMGVSKMENTTTRTISEGRVVMEDWENTKCGTCIIQRQKPICNSCLGHQFYKPMSNADKIRNMSDEELAELFAEKCKIGKEFAMCWLKSEVNGSE